MTASPTPYYNNIIKWMVSWLRKRNWSAHYFIGEKKIAVNKPKYYVIFDTNKETILSAADSSVCMFSSAEEACIMAERTRLTDYIILKITGVCKVRQGTIFEKIS